MLKQFAVPGRLQVAPATEIRGATSPWNNRATWHSESTRNARALTPITHRIQYTRRANLLVVMPRLYRGTPSGRESIKLRPTSNEVSVAPFRQFAARVSFFVHGGHLPGGLIWPVERDRFEAPGSWFSQPKESPAVGNRPVGRTETVGFGVVLPRAGGRVGTALQVDTRPAEAGNENALWTRENGG
jgi:hypothetical protein